MQIVGWKTFFAFLEIEAPVAEKGNGWRSDSITDAQKNYLRKLGIGHTGMSTKGQAAFTIDIAVKRRDQGLATPGQMWAMAHMNYKALSTWTFVQAKEFLTEDGYQSRCAPERVSYQTIEKRW